MIREQEYFEIFMNGFSGSTYSLSIFVSALVWKIFCLRSRNFRAIQKIFTILGFGSFVLRC